jgi:anthranilate synthase component 2
VILLIDNYDSFTWNLVQAMAALGADVRTARNDALSPAEALALAPRAVVLSPGPGRPAEAGMCLELLARLPRGLPLLGVCLGHQALVEHCGGRIERDPAPAHGRSTEVLHAGGPLYRDLASPFRAGRYHSLRAATPLPEALELEAWTADGLVMGVRQRELPRFGVQFHPESILTPGGQRLLERFLAIAGELPAGARPARATPAQSAVEVRRPSGR